MPARQKQNQSFSDNQAWPSTCYSFIAMAGAAIAGPFPEALNPCMGWPVLELRREVRYVCEGDVRLTPEACHGASIGGELLDVSASGFRAAFRQPLPPVGAEVEFAHQFFRGLARIVWIRLVDGRHEAGCMVLRDRSTFQRV
jgi:hypothetical protein